MIISAGFASSQLWPSQNIGLCKWIPAFAGMKRSGGDAATTEEMDAFMKRSLQEGCMKHSIRGKKTSTQSVKSVVAVSVFSFFICLLLFLFIRHSIFNCSSIRHSLFIICLYPKPGFYVFGFCLCILISALCILHSDFSFLSLAECQKPFAEQLKKGPLRAPGYVDE